VNQIKEFVSRIAREVHEGEAREPIRLVGCQTSGSARAGESESCSGDQGNPEPHEALGNPWLRESAPVDLDSNCLRGPSRKRAVCA
jgi:hypothetical protein